MSNTRKFTYRNLDWVWSVEFFPDRIEYGWDKFGKGFEKGNKIVLREELSPYLTDAVGSNAGYKKSFQYSLGYLALAILAYEFLPSPWRYLSCFFMLLFIYLLYDFISRFRSQQWIQINRKNGVQVVSVQATIWTETEKLEFKNFYTEWVAET